MKINSDAAVFNNGKIGLGCVLRDEQGSVCLASCHSFDAVSDITMAEALAARFSLFVALDTGFSKVILEVDCLNLFYKLMNRTRVYNALGIILNDIFSLYCLFVSLDFSFVRRTGNKVAHVLANSSRDFEDVRVWSDVIPPMIFDVVAFDAS
uniref:RNase H type-1 domain-containing protein n=1 Tax=Chenopodium quinoa TaxID=63459 RepID=A0A803MBN7_CHEQI